MGRVRLNRKDWLGIQTRLRKLCDEAGSVAKFARKIGVNERLLRRWLARRDTSFELSRVFDIANRCNKAPSWFLLGEGPEDRTAARPAIELAREVTHHIRAHVPAELRRHLDTDPRGANYPDGAAALEWCVAECVRQMRLILEWQERGLGSVVGPIGEIQRLYGPGDPNGPLTRLAEKSEPVRAAQARWWRIALQAAALPLSAPDVPFFPSGLHQPAPVPRLGPMPPRAGGSAVASLLDYLAEAVLVPAANLAKEELQRRRRERKAARIPSALLVEVPRASTPDNPPASESTKRQRGSR